MLRVYQDRLVGLAQQFPREIEDGIDRYLAMQAATDGSTSPEVSRAVARHDPRDHLCRTVPPTVCIAPNMILGPGNR
jgi:hypothetical protein